MVEAALYSMKDYKSDVKPTWCPGCGDFAVLSAAYKAFIELQLKPENIVVVSGIGCSSRIPYFIRTYGLHTLHGRSIPLATGVKLANPELTVVVFGGDGDLFSIGTGHLPHAARRNLDITVVMMDNQIYGLTKAQYSPTSRPGHITKSSPYGTVEMPMRPAVIALASGATYVARGYSAKPKLLQQLIVDGIRHKGFSFIQVISPCVEWNNTFQYYDAAVQEIGPDHDPTDLEAAFHLALSDEVKVPIGLLYRVERPTYNDLLYGLVKERAPFDVEDFLSEFE
jgi:2-oxoglutarate ferredoxin oxidoreductase subunit beta